MAGWRVIAQRDRGVITHNIEIPNIIESAKLRCPLEIHDLTAHYEWQAWRMKDTP